MTTPPAIDATPTDEKLRLHIEAVERLNSEKQAVQDDIRERYSLLKAEGYDPKIVRQVVKLRAMKPDDRKEMQAVLDAYMCALGLA